MQPCRSVAMSFPESRRFCCMEMMHTAYLILKNSSSDSELWFIWIKTAVKKNCFILIQWFRWDFEPLTLKFVFPRLKQCQASASGFDKMVGANSAKGFTCVHGRTLKSLEKPQIVKNLGLRLWTASAKKSLECLTCPIWSYLVHLSPTVSNELGRTTAQQKSIWTIFWVLRNLCPHISGRFDAIPTGNFLASRNWKDLLKIFLSEEKGQKILKVLTDQAMISVYPPWK